MGRCLHHNVDQFECCMDCGRNIWETDKEYHQYLMRLKQRNEEEILSNKIEDLERELGIKHPGNTK